MQLALFTRNDSKTLKALRKRSKKTLKPNVAATGWDLWSQPADGEQEMALLFLDIRNFTPLVEDRVASDVIHIVKKLFSNFQTIIRAHHGRIIETTGDGFYAAFGFRKNIRDAVNQAVQAGLSILKCLEMMNERSFEKNLQRRIDVGIGVHAGKVATGTINLGGEEHVMVMGYPVNIAARLQSATKTLNNNFVVSSAVYNLLENPPANSATTTLSLKGVTDAFQLHLIGNAYV